MITGSKRHSLHAVKLSQWSGKPCVNCVAPPAPSNGGRLTFWGKPVMRTAGCLVLLLIKAGDVETNPGPTNTRKQVWIRDICHRQIHVRKQMSIRCNRIEHWVHLRCAGIRLAQYTNTWPCHQHKESRLNTTLPSQTLAQVGHPLPPNSTHTTGTKTQTHIPLSL